MTLLHGWGRTAATSAEVVRPTTAAEVAAAVASGPARGVVARGLGRAYGDAAQNGGGRVVDTTGLRGVLDLDAGAGTVRVAGGTSFEELLRHVVPEGWFVPVTPGTRFVTVGGAIASDVHGKNHHVDGTFGDHVRELVLALPDGSTRALDPASTPEEHWATCGGMGLTGTILEATVALSPIETSRLAVDTERLPDLDALLDRLRSSAATHRYSVAWVDLLARGGSLGRSVLTAADFAPRAALAPGDEPLRYDPGPAVPARLVPPGLLTRGTVRAFNELWFRRAPARRTDELQSIPAFFHPLDLATGWNHLYGRRGFLQWQMVVPFGAEAVLQRCLETLAAVRAPSFFAVLKTMGPANPGPLSFPTEGWTLALDVPAGSPDLAAVLDDLDLLVVGTGGRLYLAKDSRMRPELVARMYPRLDEWRAVRDRLDPERRLRSDLARRLRLLG